jgi:hypothetical protein
MGSTKSMESNYTRYCNDSFGSGSNWAIGMDRFSDISVEYN